MSKSRREFLRDVGLGASAVGASLLLGSSSTGVLAAPRRSGRGRVLVMVQLSGGNDGLNSVIPFEDDAYHRARPRIRIPKNRVLRLSSTMGLHPEMKEMRALFEGGRLAIVQGTGYPAPSRSHFRSMEIWHTGNPTSTLERTGWLGRYLAGRPVATGRLAPGALIGEDLPLAMVMPSGQVAVVPRLDRFFPRPDPRAGGDRSARIAALRALTAAPRPAGGNPTIDRLVEASRATLQASDRLRRMARGYVTPVRYAGRLGRRLRLVATMIQGGADCEVYYLAHGGYDHHANQPGRHAQLLRQLSQNLAGFHADMRRLGKERDVLVVVFSEFGRRVAENGSRGTDHGTAGPTFLLSGALKGGLYGAPPSLTSLDNGDLKYTTDFRRIYATVLKRWLGTEPTPILRSSFTPLPIL